MKPEAQTKKPKRVGLLLLTEDGSGRKTAHLKTRPQSSLDQPQLKWSGLSLVTVGGKIGDDENEMTALLRLLHTQFGKESHFSILLLLEMLIQRDPEKQILFQDERITLFGLMVPPEYFNSMNCGGDSAEFTQVTAKDLSRLVKAKEEWKRKPHKVKGIVVFPETRVALIKAFKRL